MTRISALTFGTLLSCALLTTACDDRNPVSPPTLRPALAFEIGSEEMPDSGEIVVYPSDGVEDSRSDAAVHLRTMGFEPLTAQTVAAPDIRIGVIQSTSAVIFASAASYEVRDKATGLSVMTGTNGGVTVSLASVMVSYYRLQVMCSSAASVATRKAAAEALGYVTFTAFNAAANCTRLYVGEFAPPPANNFAVRTTFRNKAIADGIAQTDSFWSVVSVGGNTVYRVTRGTTVVDVLNPVVFTSSDGLVTIGDARYRGKGEARINLAGSLAGINVLSVEDYLYGVVPRELGPVAFPEVEAQKAQAIAARTYAIAGLGKRGSDGYDLRATTDDQVYGGYSAEHPVSTAAVDATRGVVATYNGALISALYSSTSGGHTADNEEAFNSAPVAYLRGVPDAERGNAFEHVPSLAVFRANANPMSLRAAKEGDFESDWARLHRWTYDWTMSEISDVISSYAGLPVGRVLAINVLERGPSGRVQRIEYVTEAGTFTSMKDQIRASLKYIGATGPANLPSTLFFIEPILEKGSQNPNSDAALAGFRVYGGGFGHGVGLSQTGAVGMAQKGHSYDEILHHYYQGIELETRY
jgi:stage II sporulation protein D